MPSNWSSRVIPAVQGHSLKLSHLLHAQTSTGCNAWENKVALHAGTKITRAALFAGHLAMSQSVVTLQPGMQLAMDSGALLIAVMAFACQVLNCQNSVMVTLHTARIFRKGCMSYDD